MDSLRPEKNTRRKLLNAMIAVPALASTVAWREATAGQGTLADKRSRSLKLALNAFSFNKQLLDGSMTVDDMLEFCAEKGLVACDITGYYLKGYPQVPSDEILYQVKRKAFSVGVEISGTGVRNDFTEADPAKRRESVELVKNWVQAAQKLGAQTLRIFSGTQRPLGHARREIFDWMVRDITECVEYGKAHGIVVALQNHDDFIKTAEETIEIMEAIRSDWYGLMLDIGSFRTGDPYEEISRTIRYAVTWQIKEKVYIRGQESDVDAGRLVKIIKASDFRGYLPLETLGEGDPKVKIDALLKKFRTAMEQS